MNRPRLPQTDSIQELADFWDTHDVTEFEDQIEEVTERIFARDAHITVDLPSAEAKAVREMARARGVLAAELIREWVIERIRAA